MNGVTAGHWAAFGVCCLITAVLIGAVAARVLWRGRQR